MDSLNSLGSKKQVSQSAVVSVLYVLYFAPLVWVLYDYTNYHMTAAGVVFGVTFAHFLAGLLENWGNVTEAARDRYTGDQMWLNIVADFLITASFLLSIVALADTSEPRVLLAAAVIAVIGNTFCVAGRLAKACI